MNNLQLYCLNRRSAVEKSLKDPENASHRCHLAIHECVGADKRIPTYDRERAEEQKRHLTEVSFVDYCLRLSRHEWLDERKV
jgi:hypothetical protein